MRSPSAVLAALALAAAPGTRAATIQVGPTDSYDKIEAAGPGDEVVIAPGKYAFRVHLTRSAPADQPIVIRAQDPSNQVAAVTRAEGPRAGRRAARGARRRVQRRGWRSSSRSA